MSEETTTPATQPKTRLIYILLAIFLGQLGIHNFYAGRTKAGVIQLVLTVVFCWTAIVPLAVWIWAIIDIIKITEDANGVTMV